MKYNKAAIMNRAWELYRLNKKPLSIWSAPTPITLSQALTEAWGEAKCAIKMAQANAEYEASQKAPQTEVERFEAARFIMAMKDRWMSEDYAEDSRLAAKIAALKAA